MDQNRGQPIARLPQTEEGVTCLKKELGKFARNWPRDKIDTDLEYLRGVADTLPNSDKMHEIINRVGRAAWIGHQIDIMIEWVDPYSETAEIPEKVKDVFSQIRQMTPNK